MKDTMEYYTTNRYISSRAIIPASFFKIRLLGSELHQDPNLPKMLGISHPTWIYRARKLWYKFYIQSAPPCANKDNLPPKGHMILKSFSNWSSLSPLLIKQKKVICC